MNLEGRTVIVTGAGSGIGLASALEFAHNGARVVCCGRRKERLVETVGRIEAEGGVGLAVPTDVTDAGQVGQMVSAALERFGTIDVLFNNAGSLRSIGGVFEIEPDSWWHDVKVNLYGSLLVMRAVLPHMMTRDEGIIINMNGGRSVGVSGYGCSKAALMELTGVLSEELETVGSSVIVLSASPGFVRTEMAEFVANSPAGRKWLPWAKEAIDTGQTREPEEIARATIKIIRQATPEFSGGSYGLDGVFSSSSSSEQSADAGA